MTDQNSKQKSQNNRRPQKKTEEPKKSVPQPTRSAVKEFDFTAFQTALDNGMVPSQTAPAMFSFGTFPWAWVKLGELAEVVDLLPSDLVSRWGLLSNFHPGWLIATNCVVIQEFEVDELAAFCREFDLTGKLDYANSIFVPVGWSQAILKAVKAGYAYVTVTTTGYNDPRPEDSLGDLAAPVDGTVMVAIGHRA